MKYILLTISIVLLSFNASAQLTIDGGSIIIGDNAAVLVKGNVVTNSNILGNGKLVLNGDSLQYLNCNKKTIQNVEINNTKHIYLESDVDFSDSVFFTKGKLILNNANVFLSDSIIFLGANTNKFLETNSAGVVKKSLTKNETLSEIPLGYDSIYTPAYITTNATYTNAFVSLQSKNAINYQKRHIRSTDYANMYWPITKTGINGDLRITGKYKNTGQENFLSGFYHNGNEWSFEQTNIDYLNDTVGALITTNGDLYAMNKFALLNAKVFLQGALNTTTGLMTDIYRSNEVSQTPGNPSTSLVLPITDPYRQAPYNTIFSGATVPFFSHTNNSIIETVDSSVFIHNVTPSKNIVDWVFVELRNKNTPGNIILQTRSALLQRDGNIVDVDGKSSLYFKNIDTGNYIFAIRHRNHLGISLKPDSSIFLKPNESFLDFTTINTTKLLGVTGNNYLTATVNGLPNTIIMYGGNANGNTNSTINSRYSFSGNDRDYILNNLLNGNRNNTTININNTSDYFNRAIGDFNFDRKVRYSFSGNDIDFLLNGILLGNRNATNKSQILPN